ncbi:hypothetical protein PHYBOEH_005144 [Phytophthora boehmeriae]|uniref:non-specific serine/threonine protein kinase n=1 Tax=Phytophthora boehmeriae TaxID=109152 RepID=A0A8T1WRE4_9STRA|nr:hypothetical protein PHYBOEH_005144 [Phytophthora boehmeriae]
MNRFEELKCIGRGSYGSAHLVRERAGFHQRYVVKKIPMELLSVKEKDQSFREVELLAKLKHPNVVEYKENFVVDNVLHIVMAYCDGGDLAEKIKTQKKTRESIVGPEHNPTDPRGYFPIGQVLDWFVQMAMAIKYLHAQRVLHRDLKTSNVFLTTENVVKLGDFGIAKTLDSTLDQAKTVVGTPYYMSPEVCESKPYSYASDVWALGCVLYEMLALRHAFDAPNILTLILKIVQQDFAAVPPHYDKEVSDLLHMLLDKNPERRPSMEDIFAIPYIRRHMQGLMKSGGSLKMNVVNPVARRPHGSASSAGRRRLNPKNVSARRSSAEKRKLRLSDPSASAQAAPVVPMQWIPIESSCDIDDEDILNELELLNASILEESQLNFRLPERSSTPEPLVLTSTTEEKPHPSSLGYDDDIVEELSSSTMSPVRPKSHRDLGDKQKSNAWRKIVNDTKPLIARSRKNEVEDDDNDSRFNSEGEDMSPNFQNEYSEECIDSLQIYYGSKQPEDNGSLETTSRQHANLRPGSARRHVRAKVVTNGNDYDWPKPTTPTASQPAHLHDSEDALELSSLSLDDNESETAPSLSESSIMRELELEADSDDSDASADTSQSEYEAEENFYSDDSSDAFDQSGTQYSDDFEDSEAEIIEYADDEFVSEDEEYQSRLEREIEDEGVNTDLDDSQSPLQSSRNEDVGGARALKLKASTEVPWVMRNVAQSLLLTQDDLHPRQAA